MQPWIETNSGIHFEFLDPKREQINIFDIAHSLSNVCRYVGQCRRFYSVAEHSWHVARVLGGMPAKIRLAGLLHDASEAYITDVASPVKAYLNGYQEIEDRIMSAIGQKFGFDYPLDNAVKYADRVMLSNEAHHLLPSKGNDWPQEFWGPKGRPRVLPEYRPVGMTPEVARTNFLDMFTEIMSEIVSGEKEDGTGGTDYGTA